MSVLTEYFDQQLLAAAVADAGWTPPLTDLLFYMRPDMHAYQDLVQSVPANSWGQQARQIRDVREAPGGNLWPYLHWDTAGTLPSLAPEASDWGGVKLWTQYLSLAGLTGLDATDVAYVVLGYFCSDMSPLLSGQGFAGLGGTFATGLSLGGANYPAQSLPQPYVYYGSALHQSTAISLSPGLGILGVRSAGGAVTVEDGAGTLDTFAAHAAGTLDNGDLGEDARHAGQVSYATVCGMLVYSPAPSAGDWTALLADLATHAQQRSLWPSAWPLAICLGDSLTQGLQSCPVTLAQTYPHRVQARAPSPIGLVSLSKGGLRTDQIDAAYRAGALTYLAASGRPASVLVNVWAGTNDLGAGASTATILGRLTALCQPLKDAGAVVSVRTVIANNGLSGPQEVERGVLNTALRALFPTGTSGTRVYLAAGGTTWADYLVDLAANAHLSNASDATYFNDGTHLTPAGYDDAATDTLAFQAVAASA